MKWITPWRTKKKENGTELAPTRALTQFRTEVDRLFERFFRDPWALLDEPLPALGTWVPSLDIADSEKEIVVRAEVPGVDPKDLNITVSGNVLTIAGEKKHSREEQSENYYHVERSFGSFRRTIQLPTDVDPDSVTAEHANGVVTIRLKKARTAAPKRVPVKVRG